MSYCYGEKPYIENCKISCRTAPGKQPSIRIQFPDGNQITFYQDGWCNGKDADTSIKKNYNGQIEDTDQRTVYSVGQADNKVTISYRKTGNKSIKITNKQGNGICIYPDLYVNPVKNGQTTQQGSQKINCNLFEFIENNFFREDYSQSKSFLKKPLGDKQTPYPEQSSHFPSYIGNPNFNSMNKQHLKSQYSLDEIHTFTINLPK